VDTTVAQFAASGPQLAAAVDQAAVDAVNASALAIVTQARTAIKRAVGADSRLGHMAGKPRVGVFYIQARPGRPQIVATIKAQGPAHLIERPRKGGYKVTARGKALHTPHGPRKTVRPGPILKPAAPITHTFNRAAEIVGGAAPAVLQRSLDKGMDKVFHATVVPRA
jgi:hypothetical protein